MEHFGDLLFQLMKHGTNTLHVAFMFLFGILGSLYRMILGTFIESTEIKLTRLILNMKREV